MKNPFITREEHDQRVTELLITNNQYLDRARKAEAEVARLTLLLETK